MKKFRKLHSLIAMVLISVLLVGDLSPAIPVYAEDVSAADTVSRVDPLVYDFEFLSTPVDGTVYDKPVTAGWTVESGASKTTTVEDSLWKINVEAASYTLQGEKNVAIESALYPSFRMSVLNKTAATKATLFFTTDADTSYTNTKSLSLNIQPNDTVYREYMFDMSTVSSWSGIIGQVKIVFESASGEAGGQLNVDYFSFAPNTVPADVIFDLSEGKECIENVIFAVQGGDDALVLTPTGPNASFETVDNLGLDAAQFNYFKISLQNSSSAKRLRVSFITESSPVWNTEKSVLLDELKTSDSGLSYYAFNMSSCGMWQGRIRKLRVTFEDSAFNDSNITVTAIGIFTGVILEDQVFDFTSSHEGWTAGKNTDLSQKNNSLTVNISGKDAYYCSPEVYINADEMRYITLKLKNATASSTMRIQWANDGDDGFNDIKSQNIVIKSNSPMQEYVVALGDHQRWEGIVTGLKITPALYTTKGSVQLSSIAFSQNEDTSFSGREITEGSMESSYMNGWTVNRNGGSVTGQNDKKGTGKYPSNGSGMTLELTNKGPYNNTLGQGSPTEAWRSVPKYEDGFIKWSVNVNISDVNTTGNSIRLINTQSGKDAISLTFDSGFARAALSSGEQLIASISNSATLKFTLYMNMAEHTYDVYINSILKASKVPFTNAESFDKLYIGTTGEHKVVFGYSGSLYRINELYEDFSQFTAGNVIDGLYTADGSVVVGNVSSKKLPLTIYPEGYRYTSLLAVGNNTASSFKANFIPASNVIEANVAFAVMEKADGMKIALQDGSSDAAAIKISGNDIVYNRAQFIANLADGAENVIRMAGSYAYLQSNEGKAPEYTGDVVFDKTVSGTERSVWIFHKEANGYRLENKATGLYLTMERNSNGYKLYQASERGQNPSQIFDFLSYNIYSILYNVDLNVVIYSNAEGDGVLFQNKDNWWKAPEGTDDNNKCQFFLNNGIYDSAENVIKMEGGKAYLQCGNYMVPEIKGDLTFSKTQTSEELSIWKLQAVTNGYRLKNKATGLYMTMEAYGDTYRLFQASDRGIDDASQCFTFKKYNEYYFLCQADLNVVIYSDTNGNRILYQNYADWAVPPEGANSNNKCQFKLATAPKDKAEIVIKMSGNGAYLRAYMGAAFITAKADGNGIVSSAQKAEIGTNVTVTAKANNGYLFDGWYMDGERVADTASYTFTAQDNISVIARFRLFYGDIDFDGEITLYDVVAVRTELLTDNEYSAVYDVNQNGEFDICDLVRIKKILVGLV